MPDRKQATEKSIPRFPAPPVEAAIELFTAEGAAAAPSNPPATAWVELALVL